MTGLCKWKITSLCSITYANNRLIWWWSGLTGHIFQNLQLSRTKRGWSGWCCFCSNGICTPFSSGLPVSSFPCIFQHVSKEWLGFAHFSHHNHPWRSLPLFWGAFGELCMIFGVVMSAGRGNGCLWESKAELSAGGLAEEDPSMTWRRLSSWLTQKTRPKTG